MPAASRSPHPRHDAYARVADQIIQAIEAGRTRNRLPWHGTTALHRPVNVATSRAYRGINVVSLWVGADSAGYGSGLWGTYRQWAERGAQVRRGETGHCVVFWKTLEAPETDRQDSVTDAPADADPPRLLARGYTVFNADQVDGYTPPVLPMLPETARIARAERFCAALGLRVEHGADGAWYDLDRDTLCLPDFARFRDATAYYGVYLHEAGHASGAAHRLDRDLTGRFGDAAYAMEECIVELLAAMICADLGLASEPRPDHAGYIASWLAVLRDDPRAIFAAASKAQVIADWMHALQPTDSPG